MSSSSNPRSPDALKNPTQLIVGIYGGLKNLMNLTRLILIKIVEMKPK